MRSARRMDMVAVAVGLVLEAADHHRHGERDEDHHPDAHRPRAYKPHRGHEDRQHHRKAGCRTDDRMRYAVGLAIEILGWPELGLVAYRRVHRRDRLRPVRRRRIDREEPRMMVWVLALLRPHDGLRSIARASAECARARYGPMAPLSTRAQPAPRSSASARSPSPGLRSTARQPSCTTHTSNPSARASSAVARTQ